MIYFSEATLRFLRQLAKNNNRAWFNARKDEYLQQVKAPFENFVGDLIEALQPYFEHLSITPNDAIFRIYRDVRFSKDKSPYKTKISAIISPAGRKNKTMAGVYLEIGGTEMRVYSGLYQADSKQLAGLRTHIAYNLKEFEQLINHTKFKQVFGEIRGEKNKRLPQELAEDALRQPLLYHKQFYFFTTWPATIILEPGLLEKVVATYEIARPVSNFLFEGIG